MKKNLFKAVLPVMLMALVFESCNKDDFPNQPTILPAKGIYVLNEGSIGKNNSKLGYYDFATAVYNGELYNQQNGAALGDNANNAVIYGGKMYIALDNSGLLTVCNAVTGKLINSIQFKNNGETANPRYVMPYNGKVYVSTWLDGIKVIDTASLTITQSISTRSGAEGMAVYNNNLYALLGGSYKKNYDSVISVINIASGNLVKNVYVGYNPTGKLQIDKNGNAYFYVFGKPDASYNYTGNGIVKFNAVTNEVAKKVDGSFSKILLNNDKLYTLGGWNSFTTVKVYNALDMSLASDNFITDGTTLKTPYGIDIDETNGDIYVTDAVDYSTSGHVYAFDKNGKKKFDFTTTGGINPNTVLFKR